MSRLLDPYRDIETSIQLEVCRNIGFFCCNQVGSLSKHHMSRPCLSVTTRVSSSFGITTYVTLSQQKYFFEALLLSQQALPCCYNQCHNIRGFCCDRDFVLCSSLCCDINLSVIVFFPYSSLISYRERRYLVATKFLPSSYFICSDMSFFVTTIPSLC